MSKDKLKTSQSVKVDGKVVEYGRIPTGLIVGWDGIVFYIKTSDCYLLKEHKGMTNYIINRLENENEDHGTSWRETGREIVKLEMRSQITLVSFRIRDSY